jgi:hypothetical protein
MSLTAIGSAHAVVFCRWMHPCHGGQRNPAVPVGSRRGELWGEYVFERPGQPCPMLASLTDVSDYGTAVLYHNALPAPARRKPWSAQALLAPWRSGARVHSVNPMYSLSYPGPSGGDDNE